MKHFLVVGSLVLLVSSPVASGQTNASAPAAPAATNTAPLPTVPAPAHRAIIFHPPSDASNGVMPIRVGGGSRGTTGDVPSIKALVPDGVGYTTEEQPALYWYQSKPAKTYCEITVTEPGNPTPVYMGKTPDTTDAGIHAVRLSKVDVRLKPNVVYRWSVALVVDPQARSQDVVVNGIIKRIDPSPELTAKLAGAFEADKAVIYAENGIWYDALRSISDQINRAPDDQTLRDERLNLFKQVGIDVDGMDDLGAKSP